MNKTGLCLLTCLTLVGLCHAEWTTPGLGTTYTAEDLATISGGAVTGSWPVYDQHENIIVHEEDTLQLLPGTVWQAVAFVSLTIQGELQASGEPWNPVSLRSLAGTPASWDGVTIDEGVAELAFTELRDAEDGVNFLYGSGELRYCSLCYNQDSGLHCLGSSPTLIGCLIEQNREYGVELTLSSSPVIQHCVIRNNNLDNSSPLNAVAIGIQGENNVVLSDCLIEGSGSSNQASCFSHWMSGDPLLRNCEITAGRSGVVIQGSGAQGNLERCWIHDNHYSNPMLGGSGINVNTACIPVIRDCCIENNDWGVTVTASCQPDFGSTADPGGNRLHENGSSAGADFWNNTGNNINAVGNWWGTAAESEIEEQINDAADGAFGEVAINPWLTDDEEFAPFFRQDIGWTWIEADANLILDPAGHFRDEEGLSFDLSGPGTFTTQGDMVEWMPPLDASEAEILITATTSTGLSSTDTLRVFIHNEPFGGGVELRVSTFYGSLVLDWESLTGAAYYNVYRSTTPFSTQWELVGVTTQTSWTDEGALVDDRGFYRVTAEILPE